MYRRAVVPLDGSRLAETILPFIVEIAGPLDMSIVLLRVVEPVTPVIVDGAAHVVVEDGMARRLDAEEYLAPLAAGLRARGVTVETAVRRGHPVSDEIVAAAREAGADLIAMTTHGRSGLGRLLFGSVAEALLRQAPVPVFLLRQTEVEMAKQLRKVKETVR
ncbi:MAG: universal stress protein [Candidatus Rokuibacteriota bacterium]